ncbi:MAG: aminotransferase class I/II-fold pyridoxal phosphate-dependent enzyme [Candidatus Heimdallarchaeaceae archaeon]
MKDIVSLEKIQALVQQEQMLKKNGLLNYMKPIYGSTNRVVKSEDNKELVMLGSYSYLGLINHPELIHAAVETVKKYGTGAGGVRLLTGTTDLHVQLERKIADFKRVEDAIIYSSGYVTNMSLISTLFEQGDLVIIDKYDHQSIYDGCLLSSAVMKRFKHNNVDDLQQLLEKERKNYSNVLVAVDAVYSMDGDIAPLPEIIEIANTYDAFVMVDEAHSIGVLGETGHGIDEYFDLEPDSVDIFMGTLSKAIPSIGGYIAGKKELISYLRYRSHAFIFSAALPPVSVAVALKTLEIIEKEPERIKKLQENIHYFLKGVKEMGLNTLQSKDTPIIPIIIGNDQTTFIFAKRMFDEGIYVQPVVYPAVAKGLGRLRCCVMATHTKEDLDFVLEKMEKVAKELNII